jgi:hypothetical protein
MRRKQTARSHAVFALAVVAGAHFCRGVDVATEVSTSAEEERRHDRERQQNAQTLQCTGRQQAVARRGPSFGFVYAASSANWSGYNRFDMLNASSKYKKFFGNRNDIDAANYLRHALESAVALGPNFNVSVFTDSPAACDALLTTMKAAHNMPLACCKASSSNGGQGFRFAKLDSFRDSPYDITVFMDADTMPCYPADKFAPELKQLLSAQGSGVDITGVPTNPGYNGHSLLLPDVNSGVLGMRTSSAGVRALVAKWKEELIQTYSRQGVEFAMDQPIFKRLLLKSEYGLRFYPLPTVMNCKMHRKANSGAHCCAAENKCVIDHHCTVAAREEQNK